MASKNCSASFQEIFVQIFNTIAVFTHRGTKMQAGPKRLIFAAVPQQSHTEYTASLHNDFPVFSHLSSPQAIEPETNTGPQEFMVGDCPAMREVFNQIRRLAATDVPILISGE